MTNNEDTIKSNVADRTGTDDHVSEHHENLRKYNINQRAAMLTIILSIFVDMLGFTMVLPLLPLIGKDLGANEIQLGFLIASNAFTSLIFGPIWGKLSDKHGRKSILLISQVGTIGAFILLGISPNLELIFVARILDGIFGGQLPIIRAYITDITTPRTRPTEVAKIQAVAAFSLIIGPLIGGFLGAIDWRIPSFVAAGLGVITVLLTTFKLIESMPAERRTAIQSQRNAKSGKEKEKPGILNRGVILRLSQTFIINFVTMMFTSSLAIIIADRYGKGPIDNGLIIAFFGVFIIVYAGFLMKPIKNRIGERRSLLVPFIFLIPALLLFPIIDQFWMLYLFIVPFGYARTTMSPLITANLTKAVDPDQQGHVSGWSTTMQSIAQTFAPIVTTGFLQLATDNMISVGASYWLIGLTAVFLTVVLLGIIALDLKYHPDLYVYEENRGKKKDPFML